MIRTEGAIAVKAAVDSRYRTVEKIYIAADKSSSDITYLKNRAGQCNIPIVFKAPYEIDQMATGKTHGGILADVSERKFQSITSLLRKDEPFLFLLEGVEDSFNLGYIMRTLYAFGCDGLILPSHDYHFEDETLIKSSGKSRTTS